MEPSTAPRSPEARLEALGLALKRRPVGKVWIPDMVLKPAAVLIPLFIRAGELWVLLTQRRADLRAHAGQISFPGGGVDASDPDPSVTALREAEEEVGIPRAQVRLIGQLDEYPTVTFFKISPFVGQIVEPHTVTPNPSEVSEVIELPLSAFRAPGVHTEDPIPFPYPKIGRFKSITNYNVGRHRVWGVTGAILKQLLEIEATLG